MRSRSRTCWVWDRKALQHFVGESAWDDRPLREELVRQVAREWGEGEGVIAFDPSSLKKSGKPSVGVARPWCGRLGKIDNCQVGVFMAYISSHGHALVDVEMSLSHEWTADKPRMNRAGVPQSQQRFRQRWELCLDRLERSGSQLPHRTVETRRAPVPENTGKKWPRSRSLHSAGALPRCSARNSKAIHPRALPPKFHIASAATHTPATTTKYATTPYPQKTGIVEDSRTVELESHSCDESVRRRVSHFYEVHGETVPPTRDHTRPGTRLRSGLGCRVRGPFRACSPHRLRRGRRRFSSRRCWPLCLLANGCSP